jgi:hypothetical protein
MSAIDPAQQDVDAVEQYVKAHAQPQTTTQSCGGISVARTTPMATVDDRRPVA